MAKEKEGPAMAPDEIDTTNKKRDEAFTEAVKTAAIFFDDAKPCTKCQEMKEHIIDMMLVGFYALYIGVLLGFLISKRIKG